MDTKSRSALRRANASEDRTPLLAAGKEITDGYAKKLHELNEPTRAFGRTDRIENSDLKLVKNRKLADQGSQEMITDESLAAI